MSDVGNAATSYRAERGTRYPIRLFNLVNGSLIIGFFLGSTDGALMILRPHEVEYDVDFDGNGEGNIVSYNLCPHLDQLAEYDPQTLDAVPFMQSAVISMPVPSPSLLSLFNTHVQIAEHVAEHPDSSFREIADQMEESNPTLH